MEAEEIELMKLVSKRFNRLSKLAFAKQNEQIKTVRKRTYLRIHSEDIKKTDWCAKRGYLELIKWIHHKSCNFDDTSLLMAAKYGHFEILKWFVGKGCYVDYRVALNASESGNLKMLKWLKNKGCPMKNVTGDKDAGYIAAKKGHLHILEWLVSEGHSLTSFVIGALLGGNLEILDWLNKQGCVFDNSSFVVVAKGRNREQLKVMQWLKNKDLTPDDGLAYCYACENGNIVMLEWLKANGCPFDWPYLDSALCFSAKSENANSARWLKDNGYPILRYSCSLAAPYGNLEMAKFMKECGCGWGKHMMRRACENGHLHFLKWMVDIGCLNFNKEDCRMIAGRYGFSEIVEWIDKSL